MDAHRRLDDELDRLRDRVLLLGGESERALEKAMRALTERDSNAAREVLEGDDAIDRLEVEIDRLCIDVLALRQPAARDLRFVVAVVKINPLLERIADHACNIARAAIDLNDEPQLKPHADLPRMAGSASRCCAPRSTPSRTATRRRPAPLSRATTKLTTLRPDFPRPHSTHGDRPRHHDARRAPPLRRQTPRTHR